MQSSKLKCPHCDKAIGKTNMPRHLREIHDVTLTRVTCKFCNMTFKRQQDHMRHIYRCHYETDDFPTHTPIAALGAPTHETTSEEDTTHQPAYKIKKPNERCTGKLQNYKIPKLTLKQDLTPKPLPSPKKQHRETLAQIEARNQPSEDQQVARLFEDILNSTSDSGTDESAHPLLEESRALISFLDNCPTPTQDEPPTARMLIAEPQRRQVYHPHTEPISPIHTGIKSVQTTPATDNLSDSSSQTTSTKLKHRGVDPHKTPRTALREFINTKDTATATSTPHTKNPDITA